MMLFSPLEQVVIHIGKQDRPAHPAGDGYFARLLTTIVGRTPPPPLANRRFEALRMLVIVLCCRRQGASAAIAEALSTGVTSDQIMYLVDDLRPPLSPNSWSAIRSPC